MYKNLKTTTKLSCAKISDKNHMMKKKKKFSFF